MPPRRVRVAAGAFCTLGHPRTHRRITLTERRPRGARARARAAPSPPAARARAEAGARGGRTEGQAAARKPELARPRPAGRRPAASRRRGGRRAPDRRARAALRRAGVPSSGAASAASRAGGSAGSRRRAGPGVEQRRSRPSGRPARRTRHHSTGASTGGIVRGSEADHRVDAAAGRPASHRRWILAGPRAVVRRPSGRTGARSRAGSAGGPRSGGRVALGGRVAFRAAGARRGAARPRTVHRRSGARIDVRPSGATWRPDRSAKASGHAAPPEGRRAIGAPTTAAGPPAPQAGTAARRARHAAPGGAAAKAAKKRPSGVGRPGRRRRARGPGPKAVREEFLRLGGPRGAKFYEQLGRAADALDRDREKDALRLLRPLRTAHAGSRQRSASCSASRCTGAAATTRRPRSSRRTSRYCGAVDQHPALMDCYRALRDYKRVKELWDELGQTAAAPEVVAEGRIVYAGSLADRGRVKEAISLLDRRGCGRQERRGLPPAPLVRPRRPRGAGRQPAARPDALRAHQSQRSRVRGRDGAARRPRLSRSGSRIPQVGAVSLARCAGDGSRHAESTRTSRTRAELDVSVVLPVYNGRGSSRPSWTASGPAGGLAVLIRDHRRRRRFERRVGGGAARDRRASGSSSSTGTGERRGPQGRGTQAARGRIVVWTEVDLTYPNDEIARLVEELEGWDQVVGARTSEQGTGQGRPGAGQVVRTAGSPSYLVETADPGPQLGDARVPGRRRPPVPAPAPTGLLVRHDDHDGVPRQRLLGEVHPDRVRRRDAGESKFHW